MVYKLDNSNSIQENLKINLHIKQKQIHRQRKKFMDIKGEREVGRD